MVSQAKEEEARQEEQEKRAKEKLLAAKEATRSARSGRVAGLDAGYPGIQGRRGPSKKNRG